MSIEVFSELRRITITTLKRNIEIWRTDYLPTTFKLLKGLKILYQNGKNCKEETIQNTFI